MSNMVSLILSTLLPVAAVLHRTEVLKHSWHGYPLWPPRRFYL